MNFYEWEKLKKDTSDAIESLGWMHIHMGVVQKIFQILVREFNPQRLRDALEAAISEREMEREMEAKRIRDFGGENAK